MKCLGILSGLKNLRMRTQIIIVKIAFLTLVLLVVACCVYVETTIFKMIASASSEIALSKLDQKQITISTYYVSRQVEYKHNRGILALNHLAQFIQFYSKQSENIQVFNPIEPSLTQQEFVTWQYHKLISRFSYQVHGIKNITEIPKQNNNISLLYYSLGLLQCFAYVLDNDILYMHQIGDLSEFQFDVIYPVSIQVKNYTFQNRIWYQNHLQQVQTTPDKQYFFTPVYKGIVVNYDYQFSITQSLFNQQQQFFAVAKTNFNTSDPSFEFLSLNLLLINNKGQVLYNGLEGVQNNAAEIYIYYENITGFNESDWVAIEQHAVSRSSNSILEVYNKVYNSYVHVQSQKFVEENFTLIIFTNVTNLQDQEDQLGKISQDTIFWQSLSFTTIFIVGITSILISFIVIYFICKPLVLLIHYLSRHILQIGNNTNNQLFKLLEKKNTKKSLLATLNDRFKNISELLLINQTRKCQMCRMIEHMKYNSKESTCNCQFINEAIKNTENKNNDNSNQFPYTIIKKGLQANDR